MKHAMGHALRWLYYAGVNVSQENFLRPCGQAVRIVPNTVTF